MLVLAYSSIYQEVSKLLLQFHLEQTLQPELWGTFLKWLISFISKQEICVKVQDAHSS